MKNLELKKKLGVITVSTVMLGGVLLPTVTLFAATDENAEASENISNVQVQGENSQEKIAKKEMKKGKKEQKNETSDEELNSEERPELPEGEEPSEDGKRQRPERPEKIEFTEEEEQNFTELLKTLPENFIQWLKQTFRRK